jgi:hypothetical protein
MPSRRSLKALLIATLAVSAVPATASAIPPFARKYGVSCAMCHQPVPRLNAVGLAFAANGFEFAPGEEPRDTIATGDPLLRLQRDIPLGVRVDAYQRMLSRRAAGEAMVDQQFPNTVKVLTAGQVANRVSYYMYFLASERGEVAGLEDAYVQFTNIKNSGVSLIVGQFQVSDPLFKREVRLPFEDYQPYRVRVGDTRADLTYERGVMASGTFFTTDITVEVVNGQGLTAADASRQFDRDSHQSGVLRLSRGIGPVRIGAFGYAGTEEADGVESTIRVFGPDATVNVGANLQVNLQALRRWDADPFLGSCSVLTPCPGGETAPFSTAVDAAMVEFVYALQGPGGRWFLAGLWNNIEADSPVISLRLGEQDAAPGFLRRYRTVSLGAHYMLARNVRLMMEGAWNPDREQYRLITGFTAGF